MKIAIIAEFFLQQSANAGYVFFDESIPSYSAWITKKPNILLSNAYLQRKNNSNSLLFTS